MGNDSQGGGLTGTPGVGYAANVIGARPCFFGGGPKEGSAVENRRGRAAVKGTSADPE